MSEQERIERMQRIEALALAGLVNGMPAATLMKIAKIARGEA
jgi:hypothetical protein